MLAYILGDHHVDVTTKPTVECMEYVSDINNSNSFIYNYNSNYCNGKYNHCNRVDDDKK